MQFIADSFDVISQYQRSIKNKKDAFDSLKNSKWNLLQCLTIVYALGSPSCF